MPGILSTTMILVTLETQKMSLFHISSWLFPRNLKLGMFKDELFISSLLQSGPSHQPPVLVNDSPHLLKREPGESHLILAPPSLVSIHPSLSPRHSPV